MSPAIDSRSLGRGLLLPLLAAENRCFECFIIAGVTRTLNTTQLLLSMWDSQEGLASSHVPYLSLLLGVFALVPTKCCHYAVWALTASPRDDGFDMLELAQDHSENRVKPIP